MSHDQVPFVFSVDVEDYFQVSAFESRVSRKNWDKYESRVTGSTVRLLDLLDRHRVRGTFFILGWVADRFPGLIKQIHQAGHELASHGYWHQLVYNLTQEEFAEDIRKSQDAIGAATGVTVTAYRAPSFSIVERSLWALDTLIDQGFTVDSSIFPISGHDRYGIPGAKREIHQLQRPNGQITEFPMTAGQVGPVRFPIGGGYFRIFPLTLSRLALASFEHRRQPAMFYIHPWEVDPDQPRMEGAGLKSRLRHYTGLGRTLAKLDKLLRRYHFCSMSEVLAKHSQ